MFHTDGDWKRVYKFVVVLPLIVPDHAVPADRVYVDCKFIRRPDVMGMSDGHVMDVAVTAPRLLVDETFMVVELTKGIVNVSKLKIVFVVLEVIPALYRFVVVMEFAAYIVLPVNEPPENPVVAPNTAPVKDVPVNDGPENPEVATYVPPVNEPPEKPVVAPNTAPVKDVPVNEGPEKPVVATYVPPKNPERAKTLFTVIAFDT